MSREDAEVYLKTHTTTASFLVRNSSTPGVLCVSVRLKAGSFSHTLISYTAVGWTIEQKESHKAVVAPTLRAMLEQLGYLKPAFLADTSATSSTTSNNNNNHLYTAVPVLNIYDATAPAQAEISVSKRGELRRLAAEKGIGATNRPVSLPLSTSAPAPIANNAPNNNYNLGSSNSAVAGSVRFGALPVAAPPPNKPIRSDVNVVPLSPVQPYVMPTQQQQQSQLQQQQQQPVSIVVANVTPIGNAPSLVQVVSPAGAAKPDSSQYTTVPQRTSSSAGGGEGGIGNDDQWRIDSSEVAVGEEIGRGNFGRVLRGEWRGMQVAVKRMALDVVDLDPKQRADFARECAVLAKLRPHRNLVAFLGVTVLDGHDAIVLDFCGGGSLEVALLDPAGGGSDWTLDDKLAIAHDCAAGLTHLHREGIVHRDIAARNVLLDSFPFIAKLSDFGMSRVIQDKAADHFTQTRVAPARWSAPETIEKGQFSLRSDVFMFAVLLFEIFERQKPWANKDPTNAAFEVLSGRRMTLSSNVPPRVAQIMQVCWAHDPNSRPRMDETLAQLKAAWTSLHSGRQ